MVSGSRGAADWRLGEGPFLRGALGGRLVRAACVDRVAVQDVNLHRMRNVCGQCASLKAKCAAAAEWRRGPRAEIGWGGVPCRLGVGAQSVRRWRVGEEVATDLVRQKMPEALAAPKTHCYERFPNHAQSTDAALANRARLSPMLQKKCCTHLLRGEGPALDRRTQLVKPSQPASKRAGQGDGHAGRRRLGLVQTVEAHQWSPPKRSAQGVARPSTPAQSPKASHRREVRAKTRPGVGPGAQTGTELGRLGGFPRPGAPGIALHIANILLYLNQSRDRREGPSRPGSRILAAYSPARLSRAAGYARGDRCPVARSLGHHKLA